MPVLRISGRNLHLVKFGVNYKFDVFGAPLPVRARY